MDLKSISIVSTSFLLITSLCLISTSGCSKKEEARQSQPSRISATKDYVTYFGPAPTTDKGTCYAFIIYFPAADNPGKVVPYPFFTFDESTMKKVALERQVGGLDEKTSSGRFLQLFPQGVRLLSVTLQNGRATADYSKELAPAAADKTTGAALYNAVALTLLQFQGVTSVRITSDGRDLFPSSLPPAAASMVLQPAPPRLINVIAMKESAVAPVGEVDALFDRPVDIKEFTFSTPDGKPLAGDVFHSIFDMAAVLKPTDPSKLSAGTRIKVRWRVVDRVGRSAAGEDVLPLDVKVHQD